MDDTSTLVHELRARLAAGSLSPAAFRSTLCAMPPDDRDRFVDQLLGIDALPNDGPDLPRGCVPYLPSSIDVVLRMLQLAEVQAPDVFVDVGSGLGRVTALVHLLTGARAVGIEVQAGLVQASRELIARLGVRGVSVAEGDAAQLVSEMADATVFYLYCPFGKDRLAPVLEGIHRIARTHGVRVCCVDLTLPACTWLTTLAEFGGLTVHRSQ